MSTQSIDPFLKTVGRFLGIRPDEIRIKQSRIPGEFTCFGPTPKPSKQVPDLPQVRNYCFTFVLKTPPPRALCAAYQQEYNTLTAQLRALIQAAAWDEVAAVAHRLSELQAAINSTCRIRERAVTYCVFPDDWFNDPFAGGRTLPPKPPIPPLTPSRKRAKSG